MKIHPFFEIIVIFLLVFPPIIVEPSAVYEIMPFSALQMVLIAVVSYLLYLRGKAISQEIPRDNFPERKQTGAVFLGAATLLAILLLNSLLWNTIAKLAGFNLNASIKEIPEVTGALLLNIMFGTTVATFYEEVLYRLYIPLLFARYTERAREHKRDFCRFVAEVCAIVLFALGHRYLGWPAILNAFCAGVVLRIFVMGSGSITAAACVHAMFNLIQYAVIFKLN